MIMYGPACCERSTLIRQTDVKPSKGLSSAAQHPDATDKTVATIDKSLTILVIRAKTSTSNI